MNEQYYASPAPNPYQPAPNEAAPAPVTAPAHVVPPITPEEYNAIVGRPKRLNLTKGDTAFAIIAVAVCILCAVFGLFGGMALGYAATVVSATLLMGIYLAKGGRLSASAILCGLLALGLGAVFLCTTTGGVLLFARSIGSSFSLPT